MRTPLLDSASTLLPSDVAIQISYVVQQNLNGYSAAVTHALHRKHVFDRCMLASRAGKVTFTAGALVQIRNNALDLTLRTSRKILPQWSELRRIVKHLVNSYEVTQLDGTPINGRFSAHRLRPFIPKSGSQLEKDQTLFLDRLCYKTAYVLYFYHGFHKDT